MTPQKTELLSIGELVFDQSIYPRIIRNWLTTYLYSQKMKAGVIFPPIEVGRYNGKSYVIDGMHRIDAKKLLKEKYIEARIKKYDNKNDMFVDAVKYNLPHGRQLSVQETARIIYKLEKEMKFELEQIKDIIGMPVKSINRMKLKTILGPNGKPVYIKGAPENAAKKAGVSLEELAKLDQSSFNVSTIIQLLNQMIALLEGGIYPVKDEEVVGLTTRLYMLLQEKFNFQEEKKES